MVVPQDSRRHWSGSALPHKSLRVMQTTMLPQPRGLLLWVPGSERQSGRGSAQGWVSESHPLETLPPRRRAWPGDPWLAGQSETEAQRQAEDVK